jgi:hypothetical protein
MRESIHDLAPITNLALAWRVSHALSLKYLGILIATRRRIHSPGRWQVASNFACLITSG